MVKKMARAPMILRATTRNRKFRRRWRKKCVRTPSFVPVVPTIRTVNNVLCFYLPRGALDAGAAAINEEMKTGGGPCDCRAGARRTERSGGLSAYGQDLEFWAGIHYSETVRSALRLSHRSGGRESGNVIPACGDAPDC